MTDGELADRVSELEALQRRVDAARLAALAEFDARQAYAADGTTSTAAWLRHRCGTTGAVGQGARTRGGGVAVHAGRRIGCGRR